MPESPFQQDQDLISDQRTSQMQYFVKLHDIQEDYPNRFAGSENPHQFTHKRHLTDGLMMDKYSALTVVEQVID
jgi:hypothetical protein